MSHIEKLALDYKEIEKSVVKFLADGKIESFLQKVTELPTIKEQIKVFLLEKSLLSVTNPEAEKKQFWPLVEMNSCP
ncbi:MAG: hypothetical protein D6732_12640 [Methanobacteriota archaeon]|nr:MAG: hypothetical protein D6732_12640 [Euryarchaeota archaeon]